MKFLIKITNDIDCVNTLLNQNSRSIKYEYINELISIISGDWHSYKDGINDFKLTPRQKSIVRSANHKIRVKGVAGCGKTQIVANRAVEQHLKTGEKVLIITFNISLIQYIRMRINQVPADFSKGMFEIVSYHQFFKSKANQYSNKNLTFEDWDKKKFFEEHKDKIQRYRTIIIDEVQDFKEEWLHSIITYFLADDGFISIFGDGEQNIYDRKMEEETKMPTVPTFRGNWGQISERITMRIQNQKIALLASKFANTFMRNMHSQIKSQEIQFDDYYIKYWNVGASKSVESLAKNVRWIIDRYGLNAKDVVVMAESINILRDIADVYTKRYATNIMISFETKQQYDEVCKNTSPA